MFTRIDLDGRPLSFEPVLRPVIALNRTGVRGATLDRALWVAGEARPPGAGVARLSAYDIEQLDEWLLDAGLAALDRSQARGSLLFVPAAASTLAAPRGRGALAPMLLAAQQRLGVRLVLEVTHLDPGLPPSRLVELVAALRPVCRTVFARLKPERRAIAAVEGCALAGAAIEAADLADPENAGRLTELGLSLRAVGPRVLIHNVRTVAAIEAARAAGINYASLDVHAHAGGA